MTNYISAFLASLPGGREPESIKQLYVHLHFAEAELRSHMQALAVNALEMLTWAVNEHLVVAPHEGEHEAK